KSLKRDLSCIHSEVEKQLQSILDSRSAVRNFAEVIFAELLLIGKAEWAMVGRNNLQIIRNEPVPQLGLVLLLPQRRRENILRLLKALAWHLIFNGEKKVLWAGFSKRWET